MSVYVLDRSITHMSVGRLGWYLGGWSGLVIAIVTPGGPQICHQRALLECNVLFLSCLLADLSDTLLDAQGRS